ncbi:hypothetical protein DSO57_1017975 [Entomophthora muscae]|uniref:Uncharacterized protein n=1 Tax=Entomophthora muscae TaxID=34485 RepID=A0ACC2T4H6_9FUNG|nr:hypothetical protein DSO57_1017975 [Entomophthora muscae]
MQNFETLNVFQVHSDGPILQASHSSNKITCLAYPFHFCENTHKILVDTGANHTMVNQELSDSQQLDLVPSQFKALQVANSRRVAITYETVPFSVIMGNIQVKLSGPIMAGLIQNVIAGLNWLWHNCPYINWDTSVITFNRNEVGFQIYPIKMSKLLYDNTHCQGFSLWGVLENLQADSLRVWREGSTTR